MYGKQASTPTEQRAREVCEPTTAREIAKLVDVVGAVDEDLSPAPAVEGHPVIVASAGDVYHRIGEQPTQAACGAVTEGRRLTRADARTLALDPCRQPPCFGFNP